MPEDTPKKRAVLVTGGAQGLGAAIVRRFAAAGDQVLIADTDVQHGQQLAEEVGGRFHETDVRDLAANDAAVAVAVEHFGGLDVVCLNAGIAGGTGLGPNFDLDRYRFSMGVNLDGPVFGANAALPVLYRQRSGAIVITSSLAGLAGAADLYYSTAKHALIGLTRSLAMVTHQFNITVNALCPGLIDTKVLSAHRETMLEHGLALADPAEIAEAVDTVLASGETGQAWLVQAGQPAEVVPAPVIDLARQPKS
jgi:NAD(P)-dependent dehydrogenase (short-subunit alcohol dehydrogenase family)